MIAADEAAMRALADTVPLFAPEVEVLTLPGWDCLPYDRASPGAAGDGRAAGDAATRCRRKRDKPQLLVTTANAATQRLLTPFRIRQLTRRIAAGRADRPRGADRAAERARLPAHRHRRRAWRICGARLADRPVPGGRGAGAPARFLRRRDREPAPLRSRRPALDRQGRGLHPDAGVRSAARRGHHQALPLALSREVRRHRDRRPALPGGVRRPADGGHGALAAAVRGAARRPCSTISARTTSSSAMPAPTRRSRRGARRSTIITQNRVRAMAGRAGQLSPARARRALSAEKEWDAARRRRGRSTSPRPSPSPRASAIIDFGVEPARDFAPERAQQANVYEAVAEHVAQAAQERPQGRARQLHAAARASGSPACSRIMASRR